MAFSTVLLKHLYKFYRLSLWWFTTQFRNIKLLLDQGAGGGIQEPNKKIIIFRNVKAECWVVLQLCEQLCKSTEVLLGEKNVKT